MRAPSKKIIALIIIAVVIIGAAAINKLSSAKNSLPVVAPAYDAAPSSELYATPLSHENAMDGTAFLQSFATSSASTTTDPTPESPSRDIARSLFANAVYLEQSGSLGETEKQALVANAIADIQSAFSFKEYDGSKLVVSGDSAANLRAYASALAQMQIEMIIEMQLRVAEIQENLGALGEIYMKQAERLYSLAVPQALAPTHLEIVRNFSKAGTAFKAFGNEKNDPIVLPVALSVYQEAAASQETLLRAMAEHLRENGIIFTSNEVGGYWNAFL